MKSKTLILVSILSLISLSSCTQNNQKEVKTYTFNLSFDSTKGVVNGTISGSYKENTIISLNSFGLDDYQFDGYYKNEINDANLLYSEAYYEFPLIENTTIVVSFIEKGSKPIDPPVDLPTETEIIKTSVQTGRGSIPDTVYELSSLSEYYKDVDLTLTGESLRNELKEVTTVQKTYTYGDARYCLQYIDENVTELGSLYGLYDGAEIPITWDQGRSRNREHVWARSHMQINGKIPTDNSYRGIGSDLHNLRVSDPSTNSSRGNDYFGNANSGDIFFPNVGNGDYDFRGDVARTLFYMYTNYEGLYLSDNPNSNSNVSMGILSDLLEWNDLDPVDEFEKQRNMKIYQYQGNRNPYIDFPELVNQLFI